MVQFKPLDPACPITNQLGVKAGPVVLVNLFAVDASDQDAMVRAWTDDALWMKKQPGFISTQLHKAIGESSMYLNYAIWETVAHFRDAFSNPEFQNRLSHYPASAVAAPHLFEKIAVPNCCIA